MVIDFLQTYGVGKFLPAHDHTIVHPSHHAVEEHHMIVWANNIMLLAVSQSNIRVKCANRKT